MDVDKGFNKIIENLKKLKNTELQVGIFDAAIAEYAAYNEYGTISSLGNLHIPARPFMQLAFNEKDGWKHEIDNVVTSVSKGKDATTMISILGEIATNDIKLKITDNIPPPNDPATIKRKKSSSTLIDTGAMRQSITYKLVAKNA